MKVIKFVNFGKRRLHFVHFLEGSDVAKIYRALNLIMKDLNAIAKNNTNSQQGFKFRGIDDFLNELHPHLVEHGVFAVPRVIDRFEEIYENKSGGRMIRVVLKVEYDFTSSEDQSKITVGPVIGEGNDSADKASNKAFSAALKYALIQLLAVPTADLDEADASTPSMPSGSTKKSNTSNSNQKSNPVGKAPQSNGPAGPAEAKKTSPAGSSRPKPKDSEQSLGDIVVKIGKTIKGKKISQVGHVKLSEMVKFYATDPTIKKRELTPDEQEFLWAAKAYLEQNKFGES